MAERHCENCTRTMRGPQDIRFPRDGKMVCIECKERALMALDGPTRTTLSSRRVTAHGGGDGQTLHHCPGCGSGGIVGRSDGSIECTLCDMVFTVQLQPKSPFMPQTMNGTPVDIPGMPNAGPEGTSEIPEAADDDSADDTVGVPGFSDDEIPDSVTEVDEDDQFLTAEGSALSREHLVQRLALEAAPVRRRRPLLERIRAANIRQAVADAADG